MSIKNIKYLGLFAFFITAYFNIGHIHSDEHFQLIEFAQYKLGLIDSSDLAWEFHEQMRPSFQVWIAFLIIKVLHFFAIDSPFTIALILRLISGFFYWFVISKMNELLSKQYFQEEKTLQKLFYVFTYFIWFLPYVSVHFSSENFAAIFLLLALYFSLKDLSNLKNLLIAGIFLAASVLVRYQMGISVIGFYLWLLLSAKLPFKRIIYSGLAFLLMIGIGLLMDVIFYGSIVFTPLNYLKLNLVDGMANYFGTEPWYYYITQFILVGIPLITIPILFFFIKGLIPLKKHVFSWVIIPFILVHFFISHKEMRFLFPIIYPFLFITFYGFYSYFKSHNSKRYQRVLGRIILGLNLLVLAGIWIMPSNEMIHNYRYIYKHLEDGNNRIMTVEKDFYYKMAGLKSSFYIAPKSISDCVESTDYMADYLFKHDIEKCFLIYNKYNFDAEIEGYSIKRVYSVYPEWINKIEGVDWQRALQTHSVFLVEKELN
jgi:phosphatidylinositol glycan class B